jgi:hypothetical protein
LTQAFFHHIILNSYGPLIKFLPQTLANMTADLPLPMISTSDVKVTDDDDAPASDHNQQATEAASPHTHGPDDVDLELTDSQSELRTLISSPPAQPAQLTKAEYPTNFYHPAAVAEQRIIWLPKDPFGLIHEIEQELTSQEILHSTEGATIDDKGYVNVTMASPEEVRRVTMDARPRPYECEETFDEKRGSIRYGILL